MAIFKKKCLAICGVQHLLQVVVGLFVAPGSKNSTICFITCLLSKWKQLKIFFGITSLKIFKKELYPQIVRYSAYYTTVPLAVCLSYYTLFVALSSAKQISDYYVKSSWLLARVYSVPLSFLRSLYHIKRGFLKCHLYESIGDARRSLTPVT